VLAARLLGVEDRGRLALLILFPMVLGQLGTLGVPLALTYELARQSRSHGAAMVRRMALPAAAQAAALLALHALVLVLLLPGESRSFNIAGVLTLVGAPSLIALQYALAILQGQRRFLAFNLFRILTPGIYSAAVATLYVVGADLAEVTAAWAVSTLIVGASALGVAVRGLGPPEVVHDEVRRQQLMAFGLRSWIGALSPVETLRVDQLVVGLFLSTTALGLYTVGLSVTNLPRIVAQSVGMIAYPEVAAHEDRGEAGAAMWRFTYIGLGLIASIVCVLEIGAGWLVPFFFGRDFRDAILVTRILLVAALFFAARRVLTDASRGAGHTTLGTVAELFTLAAVVPAIAIMAPLWGVEGVAGALAGSGAIGLSIVVGGVVLPRTRGPEPPDASDARRPPSEPIAAPSNLRRS